MKFNFQQYLVISDGHQLIFNECDGWDEKIFTQQWETVVPEHIQALRWSFSRVNPTPCFLFNEE